MWYWKIGGEILDTLGEKLKAARIENKLSQSEVAEKLLVSRQTIYKWEKNVCLPDLDNFQRICELYGFSSSKVLNGEVESTIPEQQEELVKTEKQKMDSLLFLIPFFFLFVVIKKRKTVFQLSTKEKVLLLFNLFFTCLLAYIIYCCIPTTTVTPSS